MKKFFVLLALTAATCVGTASAQTETSEAPELSGKSKVVEFAARDGVLLLKESYELQAVKQYKLNCEVVIQTDVVSGEKIGGMIVEGFAGTSMSSAVRAILDYDELEAAIQSMEYIQKNLLNTSPGNDTEIIYLSRGDVRMGAFYRKKSRKWTIFVHPQDYSINNAWTPISDSQLEVFISNMKRAKQMLDEILLKAE